MRVHFQVVEGTRRRTQVFEGIVLKRQGSGARETFTVRKVSFGVGVERTFPVHSPKVERIEVASRGEVRRAKLYYLRDRVGRGARVRERRFTGEEADLLALAAEDAKMADAEGTQDEAVPDDVEPLEEEEAAEGDAATAEGEARLRPRRHRLKSNRLKRPRGRRRAEAAPAEESDGASLRSRGSAPPEADDEHFLARPDVRGRGAAEGKKKRSTSGSVIELVLIVAVALGLALGIQAFLVKPFRIPSESMVPTLQINQRVLVDRVSYDFSNPSRGDVIVFKPPKGADEDRCGVDHPEDQPCPEPTKNQSDQNFIKRLIGLPGDRLKVIDNKAYINGKKLKEPYINKGTPCAATCNLPKETKIPPGHYFMMGDNRGESADSREWGPVPKDWLIGGAFFTYWPPKYVGPL